MSVLWVRPQRNDPAHRSQIGYDDNERQYHPVLPLFV